MSAHVLVIGGGGREHAMAVAFARSEDVGRVSVAPGNGGIRGGKLRCVEAPVGDFGALAAWCKAQAVDLVAVGPEAPLAEGIVDVLTAQGVRCFGPSAAAAQLEASKAFAKAFMVQHGMPTARAEVFRELDKALQYIDAVQWDVVIKASGLAAGKGVIVCDDRAQARAAVRAMLQDSQFGDAGAEVLIEERLEGEEASILAFCDGDRAVLMPAAQDHKRALDGDLGPNTGGMGAYAPAPVVTQQVRENAENAVFSRVLRGMKERGAPYRGVLYAGLMLTADGPRVLEFNCRFGDPETQVLLPLLEGDLLHIANACVDGALDPNDVMFSKGAAATIVAASGGYPGAYEKGNAITGVDDANSAPGVTVYHAGTALVEGQLRTSGGRVLAVTGVGDDVNAALQRAYDGVGRINFDGMHCRSDIGWRAMRREAGQAAEQLSYTSAGVDIDAGHRAVALMKDAVHATHGPRVLGGLGAFGGLFDISELGVAKPVLVSSTDGVGTKSMVATQLGKLGGLGHDLVNHCINDILVQGAQPLFFMDYVASSKLDPEAVAAIVRGCAEACGAAGCALLGGETAEMPGVYRDGELDIVGTIVGIVDKDAIIDGSGIVPGDQVIALASSGLHTNGYSLARRALQNADFSGRLEDGRTLGEALTTPHVAYLAEVNRLLHGDDDRAGVPIKGLAHITGGGLIDNPPRILPDDVAMWLVRDNWQVPELFRRIQAAGNIAVGEMDRVFNMGLGMLIVVPDVRVDDALALLDDISLAESWLVGQVVERGDGPQVVIS